MKKIYGLFFWLSGDGCRYTYLCRLTEKEAEERLAAHYWITNGSFYIAEAPAEENEHKENWEIDWKLPNREIVHAEVNKASWPYVLSANPA